uniref:Uncharacterized protein n=1 Tax=Romanomermis culicivorax TaxID=13658 RepID=A0A915L4J3_ROMCU
MRPGCGRGVLRSGCRRYKPQRRRAGRNSTRRKSNTNKDKISKRYETGTCNMKYEDLSLRVYLGVEGDDLMRHDDLESIHLRIPKLNKMDIFQEHITCNDQCR